MAAALSLTPMPVDFGNLYAENFEWGVVYTATELSLFIPAMWIAGSHMGHHDRSARDTFTAGERNAVIGLASAYVALKVAAGLHAGYAARAFNEEHAMIQAVVLPTRASAIASVAMQF